MKNKIFAISGSTKQASTNKVLLNAIAALTADSFEIEIFGGIDQLPHFNPDLDNETPPAAVTDFRNGLKQADAILICTPEYAMGVPGSLKNAIDWTVSSCEFSHKPTALITASSQGFKGHAALMETLKIIEAKITEATQLIIPFVKTKVSNGITDAETKDKVLKVMDALKASISAG